jgi:hypothetical protein
MALLRCFSRCEGIMPRHFDRLLSSSAVLQIKLNVLTFIENLDSSMLDVVTVDKDFASAIIALDEAISLRAVEPLYVTNQSPVLTSICLARSTRLRLNDLALRRHTSLFLYPEYKLGSTFATV